MSSVDDELRGLIKQVASIVGAVDHGLLAGLGDDDHAQYVHIDGTHSLTGNLEMDHIGIGRAPTATHLIITGETFTANDVTIVGIGNFPTYAPGIAGDNRGYAIQGNIWFDTVNWNAGSVITGLMFFPAPAAEGVGSANLDLAGIITGGILNVGARTVVANTITGIALSPFSSIFGAGGDVTADNVWGLRIISAIATTGAFARLCGLEMEPQTTGVINQGFWFSGDGIGSDLCFGAGDGNNADANIYYDGTDLIINPRMIGAGDIKIGGDIDLNGNNIDFPTTPNISDCLDDDTMATASDTKLATSESIKAYVDNLPVGSGWQIGFLVSSNCNVNQWYGLRMNNDGETCQTYFYMDPNEVDDGSDVYLDWFIWLSVDDATAAYRKYMGAFAEGAEASDITNIVNNEGNTYDSLGANFINKLTWTFASADIADGDILGAMFENNEEGRDFRIGLAIWRYTIA